MVADARQQFERVWQLDDVVVGADRKIVRLQFRLFLGRQHDHRHMAQRGVLAVFADQGEAVGRGPS
jgi:hypothetical protein